MVDHLIIALISHLQLLQQQFLQYFNSSFLLDDFIGQIFFGKEDPRHFFNISNKVFKSLKKEIKHYPASPTISKK
ncbi:MAG: hypothetical protein DRQ88_00745 [Epsilonproteobacteria bacterium]|nr:MAG: hypothetical protein DRQ89_10280 [Campylobacterota bacterium]RLA68162.1 MAG: hypothetical protein DRQ88_00745 [Campylobacterota bacterium]